jgi:hypothetical protein
VQSYAVESILEGADMTNAVVDRVDFSRAKLKGAKFVNAVVTGKRRKERWPKGVTVCQCSRRWHSIACFPSGWDLWVIDGEPLVGSPNGQFLVLYPITDATSFAKRMPWPKIMFSSVLVPVLLQAPYLREPT